MYKILYKINEKKFNIVPNNESNLEVEQESILLNEIGELLKLIDFLNNERNFPVINIKNHIDMKLKRINEEFYLYINFEKVKLEIAEFFEYNIEEDDNYKISLLFVTKLDNFKIRKNSCIYKKIFKFYNLVYKVNYDNEKINDYLTLVEMHKV